MDTTYDDRRGPYDPAAPGTVHETTLAAQEARARSYRAWWIGGLVLLGLIVLALVILLVRQNRPQVAQVQRRNIIRWESLAGDVVAPPNKYAVINCHCSAPVARIFTSVGATVRKGDILVELSHPTAQANYEAAQAEATTARTAYADAQATYGADLQRAQAQLAAAQERQRLAGMPPIEVPTGMEQTPAPPPATPGGPPAAGTPAAPATSAQPNPVTPGPGQRQMALQQGAIDVEQAQAQVAQAQRRMQEELTPYRQRLDAATTALNEAQAGRNEAFIRAPIAGQVVELNAQPGEPISAVPNTLVATIADLASLKVHAPLTEAQQGTVQTGLPVQVRVSQLPDQAFNGVVEQVTAELGPQVTGRERELRQVAVVNFVNTQGLIKPGMTAQVLVETAELPWVLSVPNGAVQRDDAGNAYVEVRRGSGWQRTPVQVGASDGVYTAILSGVSEGQQVRVRRASGAGQTAGTATA